MNKNLTIDANGLITKLLSASFLISAVSVIVSQNQLESQIENPGLTTGTILNYLSNLMYIITGIIAYRFERNQIPQKTRVFMGITLISVIIVYIRTVDSFLDPNSFFGVKGIAPYLALFVLFTSNQTRFNKILKVLLICGVLIAGAGVFNMLKLGLGFNRVQAQMQLRSIAVSLVYLSPVLFFYFHKKHKVLSYSIFLLSLIFTMFIVTRSFLIIHALYILFFITFVFKKNFLFVFSITVVLIVGIIVIPQLESVQYLVELLQSRIDDDTRTAQLELFWNGIDHADFIFGSGVQSTWIWGGRGEYAWLDNQVILTAWWAGILPTITYLALFFMPIKRFIFYKSTEFYFLSLYLFIWICGLLGLAIFVTIGANFYNYVIIFILGYSHSKIKELNDTK